MATTGRTGLITAALVVGCGDQVAPPPIVFEGEYLRFRTDESESALCGGTFEHLDSVTHYLGSVFGIDEPHVDFYWVPESLGNYCSNDRGGCADGHVVYSEYPIIQHEIVHAVRDARSMAYRPFEEGLAEAFGDDWLPFFPLAGDVTDLWMSHSSNPPPQMYPLAGYFVSYLADAHGQDAVVEFARISSYRDSWATTQQRFEAIFGESFGDAIEDSSMSYPRCEQTYYRDYGFACRSGGLIVDDEIELMVPMDCEQAHVLGPRRGERWTTVALEIPETGYYLIAISKLGGLQPGRVELRRCDQTCMGFYGDGDIEGYEFYPEPVVEPPPPGSEPLSLCLPARRYVLRFSVDEDDAGDFHVRLVGPGAASGCEG